MVKLWQGEAVPIHLELRQKQHANPESQTVQHQIILNMPEQCLCLDIGTEWTGEAVRVAVARGVKTCQQLGLYSADIAVGQVVSELGTAGLSALIHGAELSLYQKPSWKRQPEELSVFTLYLRGIPEEIDGNAVLTETENVVESVCFARNLTNCPANKLSPELMAEQVEKAASAAGLEVEIFGAERARELGMGAFLAVGESAGHPPKFMILRWHGGGDEAPVALVGKAVCFDTGGYSLKTTDSIKHMHTDMAGGAAVTGAMLALARNHVPVNVVALIPAVENRISPESFLLSDVIRSMSGRTIEIGSTDAEGRLILADAITYAVEKEHASQIIDIATLTGATARALGFVCTGVVGNNDELYQLLQAAGEIWGERYWRYPSFPEYRLMCKGSAADLYNSTLNGSGGVVAGMFLENFAENHPWLHLDIAGTAWSARSHREYQPAGATGTGTATLYELCRSLSNM